MEWKHDSRAEIKGEGDKTGERGNMEVDALRELARNKAEALRIFEINKDGLLRETFEILDDDERGVDALATELGAEHSTKLEGYDQEFSAFTQELKDEQGRSQAGIDQLQGGMVDFRPELKDAIVGTVQRLDQQRRETADVQHDLGRQQLELAEMKDELTQILESITPESIGQFLSDMRRGPHG